MFENRLRKNFKHLSKWAQRQGLTAYRVYDQDMPDFPYAIDAYADRAHVMEYLPKRKLKDGSGELLRREVIRSILSVMPVAPEHIHCKTHRPQAWGKEQYGRVAANAESIEVTENGLKFWVNLTDYLDTGLFIDHRETRSRVRGETKGKRFLNLFGYTGAFTVYAAAGGATTSTTVDLSNTYLNWAERNLRLNSLMSPSHALVRADVVQWMKQAAQSAQRYEVIVLDPPSFSSSQKMKGQLNIQRDHLKLIESAEALLAPGGCIYFSTNYEGFQFEPSALLPRLQATELTPASIPIDFHYRAVHRCWRIALR